MPHNNSNRPIKNNLNFKTITQYKFRRYKDVIKTLYHITVIMRDEHYNYYII